MREIKFRAWDKERKFMKYPKLWDNTMPSNWDVFYVLMQFTGLHDKNGKEGYHKDIARSGKRLFVIEWQNEEARFWLSPYKGTNDWQFMDMLKSFEIIGNIYENPELLNHNQ